MSLAAASCRIVVMVVATLAAPCWADIYECIDTNGSRRFDTQPISGLECKVLDLPRSPPPPTKEELARRERAGEMFRRTMKVGDFSNYGMIVEIRRPIVAVQTQRGVVWLRVELLYPAR